MLARTMGGGRREGAAINARIVPKLFVSTVMTCWKRERRKRKKKRLDGEGRGGQKRKREQGPWCGLMSGPGRMCRQLGGRWMEPGWGAWGGGAAVQGAIQPPTQPPGTRSPHRPPALLEQLLGCARVGLMPGSGVCILMCPCLAVPPTAGCSASLDLGVQGVQKGGLRGERLFSHFGNGVASSLVLGLYF